MINNKLLDIKDKKILYELDINARNSISKIAKRVGLSKEVVNYRIKNLEISKIITGYHTIINFWKLGYKTIRVYLQLIDISLEDKQKLVNYLIKESQVIFILKTESEYEIGFGILVTDFISFEIFFNKVELQFKKFILKKQISIYTYIYNFHRKYLLVNNKEQLLPIVISECQKVIYDNLDINILKLMAGDARISLLDIALKLNISPRTISYRIKQLEKKEIIRGYRAILNVDKINYQSYKIDIILNDINDLKKLISYCYSIKYTVFIVQTVNSVDLEFGIEVPSKIELIKIISEIKSKYKGIRTINYFSMMEYEKYVYFFK